ncbi:MAG TPA: hypothetical protein RMH99_09130 [Sandaracinaceae bacterium LLY-WYZ-13_1]|nr:hypothetical protein [Sandaracinaceae bacterium LLY-WYZ-13_1]
MIADWLRAFLLTQVVEMGVYVPAVGERPWRERVAIAFGASAVTHPIVWFVLPQLLAGTVDWWTTVAISEAFAVSAEAAWLCAFGLGLPRAAAISLFANGWSFTLGLFGYRLLEWS